MLHKAEQPIRKKKPLFAEVQWFSYPKVFTSFSWFSNENKALVILILTVILVHRIQEICSTQI
jgi:hypothetical protein